MKVIDLMEDNEDMVPTSEDGSIWDFMAVEEEQAVNEEEETI